MVLFPKVGKKEKRRKFLFPTPENNFFLYLCSRKRKEKELDMAELKLMTVDDLYISPFVARRVYNEDGVMSWVPIERNVNPTGMPVVDFIARSLAEGRSNMEWIARQLGCSGADLQGWSRAMTGMDFREFRRAYLFRVADDLMRYTSLSIDEVARRSGFCSASLLGQQYRKYRDRTPVEVRQSIRQPRDEDRYKVWG